MNKRMGWILCALALLWLLPMQSNAFGQVTAEQWRSLVQMPVEVARAMEAGVGHRELVRLAEALNHGQLPAADFNEIVRAVPNARHRAQEVTSIGDFAVSQVNRGLRGEALARSLHARLRSLGIPAGGHTGGGPPPVARRSIPGFAQERIHGSGHEPGPPSGVGRPGSIPNRGADVDEGRPPFSRRSGQPARRPDRLSSQRSDPDELGRLGAEVYRNPDRAEQILEHLGLNRREFEKQIRRTSADPALLSRYRRSFEHSGRTGR